MKIRFYRQDGSDAASASQKTQVRFSGKWMGTVGVSPILNISWNSSLLASMESAGLQRKIKKEARPRPLPFSRAKNKSRPTVSYF